MNPKTAAIPTAPPIPTEAFVPEPGKVAIRDADGSVWKIPESDLVQAQSEGAKLATEAEFASAKMGKPLAQVTAATAGVARGASLGFSDDALIEGSRLLGGDASAENTRHALNLAKEAHPDATLGGEVVGMALPMFFGGGAGAGGAVEAAGTSLAARAARAAPRALLEGAAIGVGQQSSEDALGDHKRLAENYLSAGFKGGALGVLMGTALAAGGGAVGDKIGQVRAGAGQLFGRGVAREVLADTEAAALGLERELAQASEIQRGRIQFDPSAGLEGGFETGRPIRLDKATGVKLDAGKLENEWASVPAGESPLFLGTGKRLRVGADADEGIIGSFARAREDVPKVFQVGKMAGHEGEELAPVAMRSRGSGLDPIESPTFRASPSIEGFTSSQDAGLMSLEREGKPVLIKGRAGVARLGDNVEADSIKTQRAFQIDENPAFREAQRVPRAEPEGIPERGFVDSLRAASDEQAYLATGAKMGDIRKLGKDAETQKLARERIGATLKREIGIGPLDSQAEIAKKLTAKVDEIGKSLRPMWTELDKAVARPNVGDIQTRFAREVQAPLAGRLHGEEELVPALRELDRFVAKAGENPSFARLYDLRVDLDEVLRRSYTRYRDMPIPAGEKPVRELRRLVQEELELAGQRASQELGTNTIGKIKLANQTYSDLRAAKDVVTKEAARGAGNAKYSLSDMIAMTAAIASGSPFGLVAPVANYVRKNFGNQIASHVLDKASRLKLVQDAGDRVDKLMSEGARAFMKEQSAAGSRPLKLLSTEEIREIRDAVANPRAVERNVREAMGDLSDAAPKTAAAFSVGAMRTAAWLARSLPREKAPMSPVFTGRPERPLSDTDRIRATAIVETAREPDIVVDRMLQGRLTHDHVRTMKIVAPATYARLQKFLVEHSTELRQTLSVQQQVSLSLLFEKPIAEVMERKNVTALQASFVGGNQAAPKGMAPTVAQMVGGPVKGGGTSGTFFDQFAKVGRK